MFAYIFGQTETVLKVAEVTVQKVSTVSMSTLKWVENINLI